MWEPRTTEPDLTRDDASFTSSDEVDLARLERAMRRVRFAAGTRVSTIASLGSAEARSVPEGRRGETIDLERTWWRASARIPKRLSADAWRAAFASIRRE